MTEAREHDPRITVIQRELFDALRSKVRRYADLVVGKPGWWALVKFELITLLWQLKQGQKPSYPTLNDQDVDQLNEKWFRDNRDRPLDRVMADFLAVRKQTIRQVERFSDGELSDPKRYPVLGGDPLEEWIAGDSYRHEAEHEAQLRLWRT